MRCPGRSPGPGAADAAAAPLNLPEDAQWIVDQWEAVLGSSVASLDADFFAHGGGSLAAAQLVSALRVRYPTITVADIYATPRVGALIDAARQSLPEGVAAGPAPDRPVRPTALKSQVFQTLMGIPLHILVGMRWLTYLMAANNLLAAFAGFAAAPTLSWWWVAASWLVFVSPLGRMAISVAAARAAAPGRGARNLSAFRQGAPAALAGRADPGPRQRHQPGQRPVGSLLRPGARGQDREQRPPAFAAARHRLPVAGQRQQHRARGGPVRVVDRRRHRAHRPRPRRRRGHRRRPQHPDARSEHRRRRPGGAGLRRARQGQGRAAGGGLPG